MNVTDGRTDGHRMTAKAALMHSIARQKLTESRKLFHTLIILYEKKLI